MDEEKIRSKGTLEQAEINAKGWLEYIHEEGFLDVEMFFVAQYEFNGYYLFHFKHKVTQKIATLEIHGFTEEECTKFVLPPPVYWNGSHTGNEKIEDWLEEGFKFKIVYYK